MKKTKLKLRRETIAVIDDLSKVAGAGGTAADSCVIQCSLLTCGACPTAQCTVGRCGTVTCPSTPSCPPTDGSRFTCGC